MPISQRLQRRGRARSSRHPDGPRPQGCRHLRRRGWHRLHVCAGVPPGHEGGQGDGLPAPTPSSLGPSRHPCHYIWAALCLFLVILSVCSAFSSIPGAAFPSTQEVRTALKIRTAFNLLGPMLNPAGAKYGLVGVYSTSISALMGDALRKVRQPLLPRAFCKMRHSTLIRALRGQCPRNVATGQCPAARLSWDKEGALQSTQLRCGRCPEGRSQSLPPAT